MDDELPDAAPICQREFQRTQDPKTGLLAAKALYKNDRAAARWTASLLLTTSVQSDALQLLGQIALEDGRLDDATTALETAQELHRAEHRPRELARDDGVLASVRTDRSEFAEALQLLEECINLFGDMSTQWYCHTTAARTLIQVGYFSAAEMEIELAKLFLTKDNERIALEYQIGNLAQESEHHESAIRHFESVLRHSGRLLKTELNLAYSLAEQERIGEAQYYLDDVTSHDRDHQQEAERTWVAAQIAYRQHDLTRAISLTEQYFQRVDLDDSDDRIDVAILAARIELESGDLGSAMRWAQLGVDQAERIRSKQLVLELRPLVLDKRRTPYELLFTALARAGQVEAAALAFDKWQGRTVQDALARPRPSALLDYRGIADQVTRLGNWLRAAFEAPFAMSPNPDAVLGTMRGIDLLALIVANGDVWSLTANHSPPRLSKLGSFAEIKVLVDRFRGHPATDVELAAKLGTLLVPDDSFRETREVLHVLVDGQLAGLPVAALRRGGTPLIAMRPIVRVLRLPEIRCVHVARSGAATVLAGPDTPDAKLPNAPAEADQIAGLLHTASKTGAAATRDALFAAASDGVLHVAAHGRIGMYGAALVLADGEVSALEITARQRAPSLVVLSACNGASSNESDLELAGSLVSGFLGAGSQHVVATLLSVSDVGALEISTRFYRARGVTDPARALADVQAELVNTDNVDWPYFAVFGPDVCLKDAPDHQ